MRCDPMSALFAYLAAFAEQAADAAGDASGTRPAQERRDHKRGATEPPSKPVTAAADRGGKADRTRTGLRIPASRPGRP